MVRAGEKMKGSVIASVLLLLLVLSHRVFGVTLFNDSFDRSASFDIDGSSSGMSGTLAPLTYLERTDTILSRNELTNVENNALHLADGNNMSSMYLDHNFIDAAITTDGGMRIGLTIVSNDGSNTDYDRYVGFGVGMSQAEAIALGLDHDSNNGMRGRLENAANSGVADFWVGWSPVSGGTIQVFKNGPSVAGGQNYNAATGLPLSGNDRLEIELSITDFTVGSVVSVNILWNSNAIASDTFTWDQTNGNYIGINARQSGGGFTVDDLTIATDTFTITPAIVNLTATPASISSQSTSASVAISWSAAFLGIGATYTVAADKAVVFPNGDDTGTAVNGNSTVDVTLNAALGDVRFTVTLFENEIPVASDTVTVTTFDSPDPNRPNVLIILLDDTGWSDIGAYGSEIETPYMDSLAAGGVRFRQFYQAARCAPTRIALLTGLYTQQGATNPAGSLPPLRTDNNITIAELLDTEQYRTYMSGKWHLGNKAAGRDPISRGFMHVFGQGANVDGANTGSAFGYWNEGAYSVVSENNEVAKRRYGAEGIQFHYSDGIGDHGVDFIDHHVNKADGKPFFLYMAFNAPHWPVNAPAQIANKYTDVGDPTPGDTDVCLYEQGWDVFRAQKHQRQLAMGVIDSSFMLSPRGDHPEPPTPIPAWNTLSQDRRIDLARRQAVYAAMIDQVDQNIGKVIDKLTQEGLFDNTLIFLCFDNGANYEGGLFGNSNSVLWAASDLDSMGQPQNGENSGYPRVNQGGGWANMSNAPFRLFKHFTHEGGIRTAAILHWTNRTDPAIRGTWTDERGHLIDVMSTVVDATGADYPTSFEGHHVLPMEGVSLLPVLQGQTLAARDIGVEHESNRAFFRGGFKFVTKNFSFTDGSSPANELELYNLDDDPTELQNLAGTHSGKLLEMVDGWNAWATRVGVPSNRLIDPDQVCLVLTADVAGPQAEVPDCVVNLYDFVPLMREWFDCRLLPTSECP